MKKLITVIAVVVIAVVSITASASAGMIKKGNSAILVVSEDEGSFYKNFMKGMNRRGWNYPEEEVGGETITIVDLKKTTIEIVAEGFASEAEKIAAKEDLKTVFLITPRE